MPSARMSIVGDDVARSSPVKLAHPHSGSRPGADSEGPGWATSGFRYAKCTSSSEYFSPNTLCWQYLVAQRQAVVPPFVRLRDEASRNRTAICDLSFNGPFRAYRTPVGTHRFIRL